jgi:hypothetical protein
MLFELQGNAVMSMSGNVDIAPLKLQINEEVV